MAVNTEHKHFWHLVIVILLVILVLGQLKLYRGQQHLKQMVSEGFIQMKEESKKLIMEGIEVDKEKNTKMMKP